MDGIMMMKCQSLLFSGRARLQPSPDPRQIERIGARLEPRPAIFAASRATSGGILLVTLVVCSLVGIMLACYLRMVGSQHSYTFRSQTWNNAMPVCESGVEEAMAHLNYYGTTNDFAVNGWVLDGGLYKKDRATTDGRYSVSIDTNFPPTVTSRGEVLAPLQSDRWISRSVRVRTKWNRRFPQSVLVKGSVDLGGTSSRIDSFNSTNSAYSTGGQYDLLKATDQASVVSLANVPGQFNVANTKIFGRIGTSPGGTVTLGAAGAVGDSGWCLLNTGIQAGHQQTDLNIYIPDVIIPTDYGPVFTPSGGTNGGVVYKYLLDRADYQMADLALGGNEKMLVLREARLYVTGQINVGGSAYMELKTNASLTVYVGGNVSIEGQGIVNGNGYAKNLSLLGLPTCTSIRYGGTSKFIGTIYAPQAFVEMRGNAEVSGAVVGKDFDFRGGVTFHYDESLQGDPLKNRFVVASWIEL